MHMHVPNACVQKGAQSAYSDSLQLQAVAITSPWAFRAMIPHFKGNLYLPANVTCLQAMTLADVQPSNNSGWAEKFVGAPKVNMHT